MLELFPAVATTAASRPGQEPGICPWLGQEALPLIRLLGEEKKKALMAVVERDFPGVETNSVGQMRAARNVK